MALFSLCLTEDGKINKYIKEGMRFCESFVQF